MLEAERRDLSNMIENKSRIILVHSTSGYKYVDYCVSNSLMYYYAIFDYNDTVHPLQNQSRFKIEE